MAGLASAVARATSSRVFSSRARWSGSLELQPMQTPKMKAAASKRPKAIRVRDGDIVKAPEIVRAQCANQNDFQGGIERGFDARDLRSGGAGIFLSRRRARGVVVSRR